MTSNQIEEQAKTKRIQLIVIGVAAFVLLGVAANCYEQSPSTPVAASPGAVAPEPAAPSFVPPPPKLVQPFETDPTNNLPVMTMDALVAELSNPRSDFTLTPGDRLHIVVQLNTDDVIGHDSLYLIRSPIQFLQERFNITAIPTNNHRAPQ